MPSGPDNVIVDTRIARLLPRATAPATAELAVEALCALAESLELLSQALASLNASRSIDLERVRRLQRRVCVLTHYVASNGSTLKGTSGAPGALSSAKHAPSEPDPGSSTPVIVPQIP